MALSTWMPARFLNNRYLYPAANIDAVMGGSLNKLLHHITVKGAQRALHCFKNGYFGGGAAQACGEMGEFKGYEPAANKNKTPRQFFKSQKFVAVQQELTACNGQLHGLCAGGDDKKIGLQLFFPDPENVAGFKCCRSGEVADAVAFQTRHGIIRYLGGESIFGGSYLGPVYPRRSVNAQTLKVLRFGYNFGHLVIVLFGLTAMQGADAPGSIALFHYCNPETFSCQFHSGGLTAGSCTDDDNIKRLHENTS